VKYDTLNYFQCNSSKGLIVLMQTIACYINNDKFKSFSNDINDKLLIKRLKKTFSY